MNDINSTHLSERFLENYDIAHNVSMPSKKLWSLINDENKNSQKDTHEKTIKVNTKNESGYCIRCKDELKKDIDHPFCKSCYSEWSKFKNPDYVEKYCHICGNQNKGSFAKPVCYSCFKKL
jgi:hypothetical protein